MMTKRTLQLSILLASLLFFQSCAQRTIWYKGNTHAHTVICGHADSPPEVVTQWYHDHGYNFLILSEHNHFIDPDSVIMPENLRDNFILIPGEEVSGPKIVHTTAMNIQGLVSQRKDLEVKAEIIQDHVDSTLSKGGHTILNHPNYIYTVSAADIMPVNNLYMFELYNGHPLVNNAGDSVHVSTEVLWDELLTAGMTIFGVSSDDAHYFATMDSLHSNPGRGWVMVNAPKLSGDAITAAMNRGDFYASNGVILKQCSVSRGVYRVEVDERATEDELTSPELRGEHIEKGDLGYLIEFIGPDSKILASSRSSIASFPLSSASQYVRAKVSFRRKTEGVELEAFYAWGQPTFMDERSLSDKSQ